MHGRLAFRFYRNATAAAGMEPATFGSASEHRNICTTAADLIITSEEVEVAAPRDCLSINPSPGQDDICVRQLKRIKLVISRISVAMLSMYSVDTECIADARKSASRGSCF